MCVMKFFEKNVLYTRTCVDKHQAFSVISNQRAFSFEENECKQKTIKHHANYQIHVFLYHKYQ